MPRKPKVEDIPSLGVGREEGLARKGGRALLDAKMKRELARVRTKQALGRPLSDNDKALLRRAAQTTDFSQ